MQVKLTWTTGRWWWCSLLMLRIWSRTWLSCSLLSCHIDACSLSLSLSPLKWAKNNLPRCRGHELEGTPCPLLESTCSNYCSPTSSHGSCAEIAEDNMTKWCKPESRQIHHPPLGWGWVSLVRARMKDRRLCALLHVSAVASLHCWIVMKGVLV